MIGWIDVNISEELLGKALHFTRLIVILTPKSLKQKKSLSNMFVNLTPYYQYYFVFYFTLCITISKFSNIDF